MPADNPPIQIEVRLFGGLRDKLPNAARGRSDFEIHEGASVVDLLDTLDIQSELAAMLLVNGEQITRDRGVRAQRQLEPGDVVSIFPPLAGG